MKCLASQLVEGNGSLVIREGHTLPEINEKDHMPLTVQVSTQTKAVQKLNDLAITQRPMEPFWIKGKSSLELDNE